MQIRTSTIFRLTTFLTSNLQTRNNNATFPRQRQQAKAWWRKGNNLAASSSAGMAAAEMARQNLSSSLQSVNIVWTLSDLSGARTSWNSWRGGGGMLLKASSCPTTSFFFTTPPRPLSWPWKSAAVQIDGLFSWSLTGQKGEEKAPNLGRGAQLLLVI